MLTVSGTAVPHTVVEYSANISDRIDLPGLVDALVAHLAPLYGSSPRGLSLELFALWSERATTPPGSTPP
jgi:hypothetical protein